MSENDSPLPASAVAETSLTFSGDAPSRLIRKVLPTSGTYVASRR